MRIIKIKSKIIHGDRYVRLDDIIRLTRIVFRAFPSRVSAFIYYLLKGGDNH
jgi:hypothetical protein